MRSLIASLLMLGQAHAAEVWVPNDDFVPCQQDEDFVKVDYEAQLVSFLLHTCIIDRGYVEGAAAALALTCTDTYDVFETTLTISRIGDGVAVLAWDGESHGEHRLCERVE